MKNTTLDQIRREAVTDFQTRKPRLLDMLRKDFGSVVKDLRLFGSVLDTSRFHSGSDVDVAVIVQRKRCGKLNRALYQEGYPLAIKTSQGILLLDAITVTENEWPEWQRGRSPWPSRSTGQEKTRATARSISDAIQGRSSCSVPLTGCTYPSLLRRMTTAGSVPDADLE